MKFSLISALLIISAFLSASALAQDKKPGVSPKTKTAATKYAEIGQTATVIDETLSILRERPSLFSDSIQRMRRGRKVQILAVNEADGVKFYKVTAPPANYGWVQSDAVFGKFRNGDEERLARLVQASDGFEQIEVALEFFKLYPNSKLRPSLLLLYGDLLEEVAVKLSKDATSRLSRKEMAASAAPVHSYYLNFVSLDRYRKLGVTFIFNTSKKLFHYDGGSWKAIVARYPGTPEASEAQKRIESLKAKMEASPAKAN